MAESQSLSIDTFDFSVGPFKYTFEYCDNRNTFTITCEHIDEFFSWKKVMDDSFKDTKAFRMGYNLTPRNFYKILFDYSKGIKNEYIKISIQNFFEKQINPITIIIKLYAVYDKVCNIDTTTLLLVPYNISKEEIIIKKMQQKDDKLTQMILQKDKRLDEMQRNLDTLNNTVEMLIRQFGLLDESLSSSLNSMTGHCGTRITVNWKFKFPSIEQIQKINPTITTESH